MKTELMIKTFIILAGLVVLGCPRAYAQSEVDPDHFDAPNTEPLDQPKTNVHSNTARFHYEGNFTLPYRLQCNDKSLPSGNYSVSFSSDGRTAQLTLNRKGQTVYVDGFKQEQSHNRSGDELIVERSGSTHNLSMIRVAHLDLVFDANLRPQPPAGRKRRSIVTLPIVSPGMNRQDLIRTAEVVQ
jgi:hypothetical protein